MNTLASNRSATFLSVLLAASTPVIADDLSDDEKAALNAVEAKMAENSTTGLANLVGDDLNWTKILTTADDLLLGASKKFSIEESDGLYRLNIQYGENVNVRPADGGGSVSFWTWSLNGSVPVSEPSRESQLPTLNSLASGSTLKASLSWSRANIDTKVFAPIRDRTKWLPALLDGVRAERVTFACKKSLVNQLRGKGRLPPDQQANFDINKLSEPDIDEAFKVHQQDPNLENLVSADSVLVNSCAAEFAQSAIATEAIENSWETWRWQWGATAEIGQEDFSFLDATTFQQMEENRTTYAFGIAGSYLRTTEKTGQAFTAGVDLRHSFEQAEETMMCTDPDDESTCITGRFGAPTAQDTFVAKLEWKNQTNFKIMGDNNLSYTISANYDIDKDVFGVEMPLFLYQDKEGLGAGIRAGWRSDEDEFIIGFFFGQKFSLN